MSDSQQKRDGARIVPGTGYATEPTPQAMAQAQRRPWGNFVAKAVSLVAIVALLAGFSGWAAQVNAADDQVRAQMTADQRAMQDGPFASIPDGTYRGSAKGYGGPVVIDVTVQRGYITKLKAVSHKKEDPAWWSLAKELLKTIPDNQTTDVDTISQATYSSAAIINATNEALRKGQKAGA